MVQDNPALKNGRKTSKTFKGFSPPGNAPPAHRSNFVEAQSRRTKAVLLQSKPVHRTGDLERWRAHRTSANSERMTFSRFFIDIKKAVI